MWTHLDSQLHVGATPRLHLGCYRRCRATIYLSGDGGFFLPLPSAEDALSSKQHYLSVQGLPEPDNTGHALHREEPAGLLTDHAEDQRIIVQVPGQQLSH